MQTITMNTSDLHGIALNWAVASAENLGHWNKPVKFLDRYQSGSFCRFSSDWGMGGAIIERERISLQDDGGDQWAADDAINPLMYGDTPLEAAMRCYVASKLGDTVEIPEEIAKVMLADCI